LLVPPRNVEQLAGAIVELLSDDTRRHDMGMQAINWINQRQMEVAELNRKVYQQAVSTHSNASRHND
jgi:hypothetical protein